MKTTKILISLVLVLVNFTANAEFLENLIYQLDNSNTILAQKYLIYNAQQNKKSTWAGYLPKVDMSYTYGKIDNKESPSSNPLNPSGKSKTDTTNLSLNINQPIFDYNLIIGINIADLQIKQAEINYAKFYNQTLLQLINLALNYSLDKKSLEVTKYQEESLANNLERIKISNNLGIDNKLSLKKIEANYFAVNNSIQQLKNNINNIDTQVLNILGNSINVPSIKNNISRDQVIFVDFDANYRNMVLQQNLDVLTKKLDVEIAKKQLTNKKANFLPNIILTGSKTKSNNKNKLDSGTINNNTENTTIALTANINLFKGGSDIAEARGAAAIVNAKQIAFDLEKNIVLNTVNQNLATIKLNLNRLHSLKLEMEANKIQYTISQNKYNRNLANVNDLLDDTNNYYQSIINYHQVIFDLIIQQMALKLEINDLKAEDLNKIEKLFN